MFLQGVVCTVALSALTVVFGFILALLLAVMRLSNIYPFRSLGLTKDGRLRDGGFLLRLSRFNPLRFVSTVYVELFRATPMVVQIFLIFYVVFADIKVLPGFKLFGFIRFDRVLPRRGGAGSELRRLPLRDHPLRHPVHRRRSRRKQPFSGSQSGAEYALRGAASGHQEHSPRYCQRIRHHHQGVRYLLHHRRAGHHVRGELREGRYLPYGRSAGHRHRAVFLPDLSHQQGH